MVVPTIADGDLTVQDKTYSLTELHRFKPGLEVLSSDIKDGTFVCGCNKNRIILIPAGGEVKILLASELPIPLGEQYALERPQLDENLKYRRQQVTHVNILHQDFFVSQSSLRNEHVRRIWYKGECIYRCEVTSRNPTMSDPRGIIDWGINLMGNFEAYASNVELAIRRAQTASSPGATSVGRGDAGGTIVGKGGDEKSKLRF